MTRLLLLSSSVVHGTGYLDHAESEICAAMGERLSLVFIPYALADRAAYAERACARFAAMAFACRSIEDFATPAAALDAAEAIFVGGGNTFRLLKTLYELDLLDPIRRRVGEGMVYMGASAGTNVACPTIRTTNDMPIVEPPSLTALGLFGCQINPHYIDADPDSTHKGETREQRLQEFIEENHAPVLALREGAILRVEDGRAQLIGSRTARLLRPAHPPAELTPPAHLSL